MKQFSFNVFRLPSGITWRIIAVAMTGRIFIRFTAREKRKLKGRAKKLGLSFSNYVRQLLGLPLLKHGDPRRFKRKAAKQPTEEQQ